MPMTWDLSDLYAGADDPAIDRTLAELETRAEAFATATRGRVGELTPDAFADALTTKFKSRSIRLMAAISTLVVSIFYLIPQMVGSGSIVGPLIGLDYEVGVVVIGGLVVFIVATTGMVSTTWVNTG